MCNVSVRGLARSPRTTAPLVDDSGRDQHNRETWMKGARFSSAAWQQTAAILRNHYNKVMAALPPPSLRTA